MPIQIPKATVKVVDMNHAGKTIHLDAVDVPAPVDIDRKTSREGFALIFRRSSRCGRAARVGGIGPNEGRSNA